MHSTLIKSYHFYDFDKFTLLVLPLCCPGLQYEPVDVSFFATNGIDLAVASGTPQEDVVTLSLCDYIMGPGSTFSWWAAYYGDKPRLSFRSSDDVVSLDKFARETALVSKFGHCK